MKYIKRRRVDEEEGSENESKSSQPSMSKAEKETTDKKILLYNDSYLAVGFTWTGDLALCVVCGKKATKRGCWPREVKSTLRN
jgi:hypothetical protein